MRPGLLVGGALLLVTGILFASWADHWFPFALMIIGLGAIILAFVEMGQTSSATDPPSQQRAPADAQPKADEAHLRERLQLLERLRADGTLKPAEYKQQRAKLLEEWGRRPT